MHNCPFKIELYFFVCMCVTSDVNCGMLFCQDEGDYQGTDVSGYIITFSFSGRETCQ